MGILSEEPRQEYYPQQQIGEQIPPPMHLGMTDDFFKFRIDGLDLLEEIHHQLRGEVYNGTEFVKEFDPWLNEEGINKVSYIIFSCGINKNTLLGNLTKEEIMFKCKMLKKKLSLLFYKKYETYGLKREMRNLLITSVVNAIHSGLSRCEGGKEASQLSTASQRHDIYSHTDSPERSFNPFKMFGRKN